MEFVVKLGRNFPCIILFLPCFFRKSPTPGEEYLPLKNANSKMAILSKKELTSLVTIDGLYFSDYWSTRGYLTVHFGSLRSCDFVLSNLIHEEKYCGSM